ncbi:putative Ig domain-containing protein [Rudanella lutea]|uniref:putative Ig domain-containing protein n=1 Tax=Rudanella lutea TaxID=451374 RepID=UPI0003762F7B|nr:putative Ig domain-containing protein [Rudanella lutea]
MNPTIQWTWPLGPDVIYALSVDGSLGSLGAEQYDPEFSVDAEGNPFQLGTLVRGFYRFENEDWSEDQYYDFQIQAGVGSGGLVLSGITPPDSAVGQEGSIYLQYDPTGLQPDVIFGPRVDGAWGVGRPLGIRGGKLHIGFGKPSPDLGVVGDTYIDRVGLTLHQKSVTGWDAGTYLGAANGTNTSLTGDLTDFEDYFEQLLEDEDLETPSLGGVLTPRVEGLEADGWVHGRWNYDPATTIRPPRYLTLVTIPASGPSSDDHTLVELEGGRWEVYGKVYMKLRIYRREGFFVMMDSGGAELDTSPVHIVCREFLDGSLLVLLHIPTENFATYSVRVMSNQRPRIPMLTPIITPEGSPRFTTANPDPFNWGVHRGFFRITYHLPIMANQLTLEELFLQRLLPAGSQFALIGRNAVTGRAEAVSMEQFHQAYQAYLAQDNGAPVWPAIGAQTATVGVAYSYQLPAATDPNGDSVSYSVVGSLPAGLAFNTTTRTISGTPTTAGISTVRVRATDNSATPKTADVVFSFSAIPANTALVITQPSYNPATGDLTINTQGGNGTPIEYFINGLRDWGLSANFNIPSYQRTGVTFLLQARQSGVEAKPLSWTASANQEGNRPPQLNGSIERQSAQVGVPFVFQLIPGRFSDPDNDVLTYSGIGIPAGLSVDPATGNVTGVPTTAAVGVQAQILASDGRGGITPGVIVFDVAPAAPVSYIRQLAPTLQFGNTLLLRYENELAGQGVAFRIEQIDPQWRTSSTFIIPPSLAGQELILEVKQLDTVSAGRWTPPSTGQTTVTASLRIQTGSVNTAGVFVNDDSYQVAWCKVVIGGTSIVYSPQFGSTIAGFESNGITPFNCVAVSGEPGAYEVGGINFGRTSGRTGTLIFYIRIPNLLPEWTEIHRRLDSNNTDEAGYTQRYQTTIGGGTVTEATFVLLDADETEVIEAGITN